jgi:ABC-type branched-subunit amino acid transport system ATPase component
MLQLDGVRSGYGPADVLQGIDLHIRPGETVAILGPNGAGKSVLLKTMAGMLAARAGRIRFSAHDVTGLGAAERARLGLALLPQSQIVFPALTVEENLLMGVYLEPDRSKRKAALERTYLRYPNVAELRRKPAGALSGGQQKMVGLARAMMTEPQALLLDEPSIGLDPKSLSFFAEELAALNGRGMTLVLVEQNIRFAVRAARRVCFLRLGVIERDEPSEAFATGADVLSLYFGKGPTRASTPL